MILSVQAIDDIRHYANRLTKRIKSAGFESSTMKEFQTVLRTVAPGEEAFGDTVTKLQNLALRLEVVFAQAGASLASTDLPRIRLLLSGGALERPIDATIVAEALAPEDTGAPEYGSIVSMIESRRLS